MQVALEHLSERLQSAGAEQYRRQEHEKQWISGAIPELRESGLEREPCPKKITDCPKLWPFFRFHFLPLMPPPRACLNDSTPVNVSQGLDTTDVDFGLYFEKAFAVPKLM